jgi:hypothetical protein
MMVEAPKVDRRSRDEVAAEVRRLLARSGHGWPARPSAGAADALIGVFAQLCGTVIDRLNKAPQKNMLAFLDMLGASPLPAQAARVPLTFHLAAQHTGHVKVPALTQVAAALEKNEQQPVLFETERELVVTSAELVAVAVKEGSADTFDDHSAILKQPAPEGVPMLHGTKLLEHVLYIDLAMQSPPQTIRRLGLVFELTGPIQSSARSWLQWEIWNGTALAATPLQPLSDGTQQLTSSGAIVFESPPPIPQTEVNGRKGYWLRCRTLLPLTDMARMPSISGVTVRLESAQQNIAVEAALANSAALDPTKDFFPLGQHPAFGDTLYLACAEAFSKAGATVTMHLVLTNPASGGHQTAIPPISARSARLRWELWDGSHWVTVGESESGREVRDDAAGFRDTTKALTESGAVTIRIPPSTSSQKIGGRNSFWIRVRLVSGDYGRAAAYEKGRDGAVAITPASFAPPAISTSSVDYDLLIESPPKVILAYNDFTFSTVDPRTGPFFPFRPASERTANCYLGFTSTKDFSDRSMSIYFGVGNPPDRKTVLDMSAAAQATPVWEYWNGTTWARWTVVDDTDGFRRSGIVRFLAPRDFTLGTEFGKTAYWLRVRVQAGAGYQPRLRMVLLNTTMASQSVTMKADVLGSSTGTPSQKFRTTKSPVLAGQQLEVLEPAMPSARAQRVIRDQEGDDAIRQSDPDDLQRVGVWVRWHEVPNFNGSGPGDRHYVIDRESGEVVFGDGVSGRIPSAAAKNIVMSRYRTGGGASGNRKPQTIQQLNSSIPYIDKVTNPEPAAGGSDAESIDRLIDRAPRQLRHGFRAVTAQDFEDLAMLASPEVARARCIPLYDLAQDPDARLARPGVVSLIIAPVVGLSAPVVARPTPTMELIRRVRDYLDEHRLTEADLVIVGPEYVAIKVEAEVTVSDVDTASEVELAVTRVLSRFLHPITGRMDRSGWQFGQEPRKSDIYALIEDVPGVDHVRELKMTQLEDRPGVYKSRNFLICAAAPQVTATLER